MNSSELLQFAQSMVGKTIAERYRLDKVLGIGGTGVVFQALVLEDDSLVAVKTIRKDLAHERAIARFFRGARLASGLSHPGVVPTLAYGHAKGTDRLPFQVMPMVEGPSWEDLAPDKLEISEKIWLICQVLDSLAYVHARGVLHRDIKPANILLERQPDDTLRPLIMDFGISAAFRGDRGEMHITGANSLVGTPAFMAPEQAQAGAMNGPELDLYAVGVMLFLLLSERLPFQGTPMEMLAAKSTAEPPGLDVAGLDPDVAHVVGRMIAREPHHRYALAAQARRALEAHSTPLVVTDERLEDILIKGPRLRHARPSPAIQWRPPGADSLQQAWPTLVVASPHESKTTTLAGRDGALRAVNTAALEAERGKVRVVTVLGEAGMGKTAVLEHVASSLVEDGRFLTLRAPYFEGSAHAGGVRRAIDRMLGVHGLDRANVRQAVEKLMARYDDVFPEEVDQLVDCLRPPEGLAPEVYASRLGEHMVLIARLLRRLSQTRPLLLLIDDADRAQTDLARFLEFMLLEARYDPWPMMILCSVNVDREDSLFWQAVEQSDVLRGAAHRQIRIHPLMVDELAIELMGRHGLSQPQARRIAEWASGNPLHATYIAEFLIEEHGLLDPDQDISLGSGVRALPTALVDLLKLKLDRQLQAMETSQEAQVVLESMAVLGQAAEEDLVQAMLPPAILQQYERTLDALLDMGVVSILDHSDPLVLGLTPALLRDAILARMSEEDLVDRHGQAVEIRMALDASRRRSHWGAVGDHHAALGAISDAAGCWLKGMMYEVSTGNVAQGLDFGRRAIDHMDPGEERWSYHSLLVATMAFDAGESETAEQLMRKVLESGDVDRRLQAGDLMCDLLENRGDSDGWAEVIAQMNALEAEAGPTGRCALFCARSMWLGSVGRAQEQLVDAQRALELAGPGPSAQRAAQRLAFAYLPQLQLDAAMKAAKRSVYESGDVPLLQARSLRILGLVQLWQGKAAAVQTLEKVASLCRTAGLLTRYPIALHDLGDACRISDKPDIAREKYQETIRLCEGLPLSSTVVLCQFKLVMCDILQGQPEAALSHLDALVTQGLGVGLGHSTRFGALLRAWAYAVQGEATLSLDAFEKVGSLESIQIDPQVPRIILQSCELLVEGVLSSTDGFRHSPRISRLCGEARNVFGAAGDTAKLQQIESLSRRLPSVPV